MVQSQIKIYGLTQKQTELYRVCQLTLYQHTDHRWMAKPPNYTIGAAKAQEWVTYVTKKKEMCFLWFT